MVEDAGEFSDLQILLALTWQSSPEEKIKPDTICRIWAFDLDWFNMETAIRVRENLVEKNWLDVTPDGMEPGVDIDGVDIPFGWLPTMRFLDNPPVAPKQSSKSEGTVKTSKIQAVEQTETAAIDPATAHITTLLDQIADESGLERKEVMRRAQRKRRALGPVTLWMALLLVAREQHLSMAKFIRTIAA